MFSQGDVEQMSEGTAHTHLYTPHSENVTHIFQPQEKKIDGERENIL